MWVACGAQLLVVIVVMMATWVVSGWVAASAVALGGCAVLVPNAVTAARFWWAVRTNRVQPTLFFFGEALKILLTIAGLGLIYRYVPGVSWPGVILGLGAAAMAQLLMPWLQPHP